MNNEFKKLVECAVRLDFNRTVDAATDRELYSALGKAYNAYMSEKYPQQEGEKKVCYFSAEFLTGKLMKSNLFNSGLLSDAKEILNCYGRSIDDFESFDDPALGNGGLGRLAACFADSAASCDIPFDGFGIRYKYGYFKQEINDYRQIEKADNWLKFYDAFGIKSEDKAVEVCFGDISVKAVPYIYLVPGYKNSRLNKLILFEAVTDNEFDYKKFNNGKYYEAFSDMIDASVITSSLYPNDSTTEGKKLRLMQQYFFSSASLQYIFKEIISAGKSVDNIEAYISVQLNDTHPVVAIPEFIRLMISCGKSFDVAFEKAKKVFAYTNHTVLAEALEKWEISLFKKLLPDIYEIIVETEKRLKDEFKSELTADIKILDGEYIHMANLACYISKSINGVAQIHSEIIKNDTLKNWYKIYPEKFNNKTNGVTQRRWLFLANERLYSLLCEITNGKIDTDFSSIKALESFSNDKTILEKLYDIRKENKAVLAEYIKEKENISVDTDAVFDVQIKRLHEYKRQLMNILSIIIIYFRLKEGSLSDFPKTLFIFGAKSAPGYTAAKRIIEFINIVAEKINSDKTVNSRIKIIYVSDYNVSYAEKIIPAADISEQISLAGKEASGTSNMKFMMNGAVTLGTLDGANIEITEKAGKENNYIFGLTEDDVKVLKNNYEPFKAYKENEEVRKAVDTLIDNTFFNSGKIRFKDIYDSLINKDEYFVLKDLPDYTETRIKAIRETQNKYEFMKKCLINTANSAGFSSDRTVKEYANEIWFKEFQ